MDPVTSSPTPLELAEAGYRGYAFDTGGKTFDGRDMPAWGELPERTVSAWVAAAVAIQACAAGSMVQLAVAQQPSVCRLVHLQGARTDGTPKCVAAIVTDVGEHGDVSLTLFPPVTVAAYPADPFARHQEPDGEARPEPGTWHWPERVT
jgi:hypothetical protein